MKLLQINRPMTNIDTLFEKWLDEIRPVIPLGCEGISNRERYGDIIPQLSIAFEAGFKAIYKNDKLRLEDE